MSLHVAAQHLASKGRDGDTELVHMTKGEIKGLQGLALAHGGSLSINPDTGLVEANFLKRILPMVAGAALTPFLGPMGAGLAMGGFETLRTGDIGRGLMAGLGAYGGANLAGSLATAGANTVGQEAAQNLANQAVAEGSTTAGMVEATKTAATNAPVTMSNIGAGINQITSTPQAFGTFAKDNLMSIGAAAAPALGDAMTPKAPEVPGVAEEDPMYAGAPYKYRLSPNFSGFTPRQPQPYYRPTGLGYAEGGDVKKKEESLASVFNSQNAAPTQNAASQTPDWATALLKLSETPGNGVAGRIANAVVSSQRAAPTQSAALSYEIDPRTGQVYIPSGLGYKGYAEGGDVMMAAGGSYDDEPMGDIPGMASGGIAAYAEGGMPMKKMSLGEGIYRDTDDDTASLGAYDAAMKRLEKQYAAANLKAQAMPKSGIAKLGQMKAMASGGLGSYSDGGRMLKGPGDGMSDDIPAVIGNKQPARLADGEFVVPADVVSHLGNGSTDAGAKKLYAMMDKVRTARTGKKKQAPAVKGDKYLPKFADGGSVATTAPTAVSESSPALAYPGSGMSLADISALGSLISRSGGNAVQAPIQDQAQGFTSADLAARLAMARANRPTVKPVMLPVQPQNTAGLSGLSRFFRGLSYEAYDPFNNPLNNSGGS